MSKLLLFSNDARILAKLAQAVEPYYRLHQVKDVPSLQTHLLTKGLSVCVLDLFVGHPPLPLEVFRTLKVQHPDVPFVIASDFRRRERELFQLGGEGIEGVIRLETDPTPRTILAILDRATAACLASRAVRWGAKGWPSLPRRAIHWTIEHADDQPRVSELASAMALSQRSLRRRMKSWGGGTPRDLLLWGRLIRASHLLERSQETVESVAFRLGYSTGGGLGKALKRRVGCSPTELLQKGGVRWTLEAFRLRRLERPNRET